ncbi:MAG: methyltransferase family protein [Candidatus Thorarchaeota archaeon]
MKVKKHEGHEREIPHAHIYHTILPLIFFLIWILDSNFFRISIFLNNYIPFLVRLSICIIVFIIALTFINLSHRALFKSHQPANSLITHGILRYVRNPMYLGILLIYIACIFLSISLISIAFFVLVFFVYNWMVNFEEKILADLFNNQWFEYKKNVPKWFPNPFKKY